jgi:ribosomal protein S18 acetylase RimI-like enzyme
MSTRLEVMPEERMGAWIANVERNYAAERMTAGESREEAERRAKDSTRENFPDGHPLASHRVFDVRNENTRVGYLWIGPRLVGSDDWWIWDVEIFEEYRRRGFGRETLTLGKEEMQRLGATSVGLNVFGHNEAAWALYRSLGYQTVAAQLRLRL